jgi:hypothetical protein
MRASLTALVLLTSVTACALPHTPSYLKPSETAPLRAQLYRGAGPTIGFQISKPAHVAIFEISPGFGAAMIHPRFGADQFASFAGAHSVWRADAAPTLRQRQHAGFAGFGGSFGQQVLQPRVFLLIASERPLRVDQFRGSPMSLQMAMRGMGFSYSPYGMLDDLVGLVVPDPQAHDWVSDVYVEWPEPAFHDLPQVQTHLVGCRDGSAMLLPWFIHSCPQDQAPTPPVRDTTVVVADGAPQQPDRRRPERGRPGQPDQPGSAWAGDAPSSEGSVRPGRTARPERGGAAPRGGSRAATAGEAESGQEDGETRARPQRGSEGAARPPRPQGEGTRPAAPPARPAEPRDNSAGSQPARTEPRAAPAPAPSPPAARPAPRPAPEPPRVEPATRSDTREHETR